MKTFIIGNSPLKLISTYTGLSNLNGQRYQFLNLGVSYTYSIMSSEKVL